MVSDVVFCGQTSYTKHNVFRSSVLYHVSKPHPFLWPTNIPFCGYTLYWCVHQLMAFWLFLLFKRLYIGQAAGNFEVQVLNFSWLYINDWKARSFEYMFNPSRNDQRGWMLQVKKNQTEVTLWAMLKYNWDQNKLK